MAFRRSYFRDKRIASFAGYRSDLQTITLSGVASTAPVATKAKPSGVTRIVSTGTGGPHFVALEEPIPGTEKIVIVQRNSTADVALVCHSTKTLFEGTTFNRLTFSTAAEFRGAASVHLVGLTTARWGLIGNLSAVVNSTGSTRSTGPVYTLAGSTVAP